MAIRRWLFGCVSRSGVRLVEGAPERRGLYVCIPLAGRLEEVRAELIVSDRFGPAAVRELVYFAGRRELPVDGWIVRGVGAMPADRRRVARWLVALASAAHVPLFVDVDRLAPDATERLRARLRSLSRRSEAGTGRAEQRRVE